MGFVCFFMVWWGYKMWEGSPQRSSALLTPAYQVCVLSLRLITAHVGLDHLAEACLPAFSTVTWHVLRSSQSGVLWKEVHMHSQASGVEIHAPLPWGSRSTHSIRMLLHGRCVSTAHGRENNVTHSPRDPHPNPQNLTIWCDAWQGGMEVADTMKTFKSRSWPGLSRWAQCHHKSPSEWMKDAKEENWCQRQIGNYDTCGLCRSRRGPSIMKCRRPLELKKATKRLSPR